MEPDQLDDPLSKSVRSNARGCKQHTRAASPAGPQKVVKKTAGARRAGQKDANGRVALGSLPVSIFAHLSLVCLEGQHSTVRFVTGILARPCSRRQQQLSRANACYT